MPYVESALRSKQAVAAARVVLMRDGVARTSMRTVAAEAGIPLGTLQYVFPTKHGLLQAVIEDVVGEIADVLRDSAEIEGGLAHAIRHGMRNFWQQLVSEHRDLQLMQYELVTHALRSPELESLARWQYERYFEVVADWCREAAGRAMEQSAVPFERLARVLIAGIDGLILQSVIDPDADRSAADLEVLTDVVIAMAAPSS
jgi:AcrR family transcriptional regulator